MKKNTNFKGLLWSFADNILQQIVNFIVGIILARILLPEEFGILGIVSVFIAISNTFVNSGLSDALINKKDSSEVDYNTVFWANVFLGVFTFALLFFIAPFIAIFFNQESLTNLIRITALSVVLVSFSSIQRTILTKRLDFKIITVISIISVIISGVVAIYMATNGYGIISLVIRIVLGQLISMILFWILNNWRPKLIFDFDSFKSMYRYGVNLFLSRLVNSLYDNLYYFIIGKYFSPANLGFYTRAESFKNLASTNIINTMQRVSFASLSGKTDEKAQFELFEKFIISGFLLTLFFMTILFVSANEIILIMIGDKWITSILYLKILSISGVFISLYSLNINFLAVKNRTKLYLRIELYSKLLAVPAILIGIYFGIIAMLVTIVFITFLVYLLSIYYLNKVFDYNYFNQVGLILKGLFLALIALLLTRIFEGFDIISLWKKFMLDITIIITVFSSGIYFLFPQILVEIKNIIRK